MKLTENDISEKASWSLKSVLNSVDLLLRVQHFSVFILMMETYCCINNKIIHLKIRQLFSGAFYFWNNILIRLVNICIPSLFSLDIFNYNVFFKTMS